MNKRQYTKRTDVIITTLMTPDRCHQHIIQKCLRMGKTSSVNSSEFWSVQTSQPRSSFSLVVFFSFFFSRFFLPLFLRRWYRRMSKVHESDQGPRTALVYWLSHWRSTTIKFNFFSRRLCLSYSSSVLLHIFFSTVSHRDRMELSNFMLAFCHPPANHTLSLHFLTSASSRRQ